MKISKFSGKQIRYLKDFILNFKDNSIYNHKIIKDELADIAEEFVVTNHKLKETGEQLHQERERFLLHIQASGEGVCFFDAERKVTFYNGLFMQYFNVISNYPIAIGRKILEEDTFHEISAFLNNRNNDNYFENHVFKQGKEFLLRLNIFENESFEIILTDVTTQEQTKQLKQEMTGNIAHELRTPVTGIRGFLEILLNNELPAEQVNEYLQRAYNQAKSLSELISDMTMLTRINEKSDSFRFESVNLLSVVNKVKQDFETDLAQKNMIFVIEIPANLTIKGNVNLLYSVFRNLTENAIRYAGENVNIVAKMYEIKDNIAYLSFADNGEGIEDESHLNRIFDRFYRVNKGRTRDTGGSGLGLSIVKNIILFHGGTITVKKRTPKGLEFLFTLPFKPSSV
ncbi:MAG: HAMP domain-containing histidine kinase [Culturomica sp.]|jgi:signal transduction histidine kinase|nr:HAMP domain-containing histidine kinase [Culturomica sp.]